MQRLRNAPMLSRLVLAVFVLAVLTSLLTPLVVQRTLQVVCTEAGMLRLVVVDEATGAVASAHPALDCPMCLPALAPPAVREPAPPAWPSMAAPGRPTVAAPGSVAVIAVLPRGPPTGPVAG